MDSPPSAPGVAASLPARARFRGEPARDAAAAAANIRNFRLSIVVHLSLSASVLGIARHRVRRAMPPRFRKTHDRDAK
jgi:hypothetical protein